MATAVVAVRPRAPVLGRVAAVLALASAVVHLLLLDPASLGSVMMVAMAGACLPCAWHLWRWPSGSVWRTTALVDAAMLVLHVQLVGSGRHDMAGMHAGSSPSGLMWLGLVLVGGQLSLAGVAALRR